MSTIAIIGYENQDKICLDGIEQSVSYVYPTGFIQTVELVCPGCGHLWYPGHRCNDSTDASEVK